MKSTSQVYEQGIRLSQLLHEVTTQNIERVHPETGGSLHLSHNWGNEAALKYLEQYRNRQSLLYDLGKRYYHIAFCAQYPQHSSCKTY